MNFFVPKKSYNITIQFLKSFFYENNKHKIWKILKHHFRTFNWYDFCNILPNFLVKNSENCNFLDIDSQQFQNWFRFLTLESSTRFPIPILDALIQIFGVSKLPFCYLDFHILGMLNFNKCGIFSIRAFKIAK